MFIFALFCDVSVIAGNEGVPDALQKCHSLSRDLQNNQTTIFTQLSDLKLQINNFTQQVDTDFTFWKVCY